MATATRGPAQQRELIEQQKQVIEQRLERGTEDVRAALDWKARLRRDGPRAAAVAATVLVLVAGSLVLRRTLRSRKQGSRVAPPETADIGSLIAELRGFREELSKQRGGGGGLGGKIAVAGVSAAASAAGKQAANKLIDRQQGTSHRAGS